MASFDIFAGDGFSTMELIDALDKMEHVPGFLGQLNIFETENLNGTDTVAVEKRESVLSLIQTSERGAPPQERANDKRDIRPFRTRRIYEHDTLQASELFKIRGFGEVSELEAVQVEIGRRMDKIRTDVDATWEHMRLGAIQGIVLDADGSVLDNWFTEWGLTQPAVVDFGLDGTPADVNIREKCHSITRAMQRAAKGAWVPGRTKAHALCGDLFFDKLIEHEQVKETYRNWEAAATLRQGLAFQFFEYADIVWHNYRGTDDNSTIAVPTGEAKFFPVGAREVFKQVWAPGESFDDLAMPGQPIYPMVIPDEKRNQSVEIEEYSYPLYLCLRPEMLQRGTV